MSRSSVTDLSGPLATTSQGLNGRRKSTYPKPVNNRLATGARCFSSTPDRPGQAQCTHSRQPQPVFFNPLQMLWGLTTTAISFAHQSIATVPQFLSHILGISTFSVNFAGNGTVQLDPQISDWPVLPAHQPPSPPPPAEKYWTYNTNTTSPPTVRVCTDKATSDAVAALFLDADIVGFDLEWAAFTTSSTSDIKAQVSLIQVAKPGLIALFHLARFQGKEPADFVGSNLRRLIESPSILKTGVNIAGDCTRLRKHLDVDPQGLVELSHTYKLIKYGSSTEVEELRKINKSLVALSVQVEEHLGLPLFKEPDIRAGDWTRPLSEQQKLYAASDAYACLKLWQVLDGKRQALDPAPPRPACHEAKMPIRLANGKTVAEHLAALAVDEAVVAEVIQHESDAEDDASLESHSETSTGSDSSSLNSYDIYSYDEANNLPEPSSSEDPLSTSAIATPSPTSTEDSSSSKEADSWATTALDRHRSNTSNARKITKRLLQAYHLHYHQRLRTAHIADLLQVQTGTVACYVLEAIHVAKLPYEWDRLDRDVLGHVPRAARGRFWMFRDRKTASCYLPTQGKGQT